MEPQEPREAQPFQGPPAPVQIPPPPQYFGELYQNGSLLDTSNLSNLFPDDGNFLLDDFSESTDPKRRRIARACDMCRKKKIKCDGKMPKCSHCENYKTECIFTHVEKKRNPPKGAKYIEGLENRLGRMEHLLKLSGLLAADGEGNTDLGTLEQRLTQQQQQNQATETPTPGRDSDHGNGTAPTSPQDQLSNNTSTQDATSRSISVLTPPTNSRPSPTATEKSQPKAKEDDVEALSDLMCSLVTNSCGETRYIGSSSGFSIFSPKGIQWVNEKTGDNSFQNMITSLSSDDNKWIHWKPEVFSDIFAARAFKPLPHKDETILLLKDFFENFNNIFPLFHQPTFMHLVDLQYSMTPYEGSGWWASLNVALAIAYRMRVMSQVETSDADSLGWQYFKNALAVQTELTMRNNDLLSVQALLGMVSVSLTFVFIRILTEDKSLYLQGTPNPQPSFFLIGAALRQAHSLGLHKRGSGFNLNQVEDEQRKRVFWIAYMLDKDICLRSGRPPVQDDDDMNVELPSENPDDKLGNIPLADGKGTSNLFRLMVQFSVIASKVYKQLYSVKASKQSDGELLNTIGELDKELEDWKDSIPLDFRPEHEINASHTPLILHVVVLHFAYYNCLTTIHRMSVHHGYWTSRLSNFAIQGLNVRPLNPRVFSSAALCVSAARASINLIKYIPRGDFAVVWLIIYYPVSSLVTLFANILQNPQDVRARSDLKLMSLVVEFLPMSMASGEEASGSARHMMKLCEEFVRIATVVLDKVDRDSHSKRKRKSNATGNASATAQQASSRSTSNNNSARPLQPHASASFATGTPPQSSTSVTFQDSASRVAPMGSASGPTGAAGDSHFGHPSAPFPAAPFGQDQSNGALFSPSGYGGGLGMPSSGQDSPSSFMGLGNGAGSVNGIEESGAFNNASPTANAHMASMLVNPGPGFNATSFQQPFVPQDLWSMPMTFEWDWADMANTNMFEDLARGAGAAAGAMSGMGGFGSAATPQTTQVGPEGLGEREPGGPSVDGPLP